MTPFNIYPMIDVIKNLGFEPLFIDLNLDDFGPEYSKLEDYLKRSDVECFFLTYQILSRFAALENPFCLLLHEPKQHS